ncbi:MAG: hypothetical protein CL912_01215 [Deltaproteobacteria bacterium]|nr:hypothetical protein [Deltaproteobacteria bacterium]
MQPILVFVKTEQIILFLWPPTRAPFLSESVIRRAPKIETGTSFESLSAVEMHTSIHLHISQHPGGLVHCIKQQLSNASEFLHSLFYLSIHSLKFKSSL